MRLKQVDKNFGFKRRLNRFVNFFKDFKISSVIIIGFILFFSHSFSIYYGAKLHRNGIMAELEQVFNYVIKSNF